VTAELDAPVATDPQGRATREILEALDAGAGGRLYRDRAGDGEAGPGRAVEVVPAIGGPRPFEAKVSLQVGEPGGRAVQRSVTLPRRRGRSRNPRSP
jgi:hypothetical protein